MSDMMRTAVGIPFRGRFVTAIVAFTFYADVSDCQEGASSEALRADLAQGGFCGHVIDVCLFVARGVRGVWGGSGWCGHVVDVCTMHADMFCKDVFFCFYTYMCMCQQCMCTHKHQHQHTHS